MKITAHELKNISNEKLKSLVGDEEFPEIRKLRRAANHEIEAAANFQTHGYTTFDHLANSGMQKLERLADQINRKLKQS